MSPKIKSVIFIIVLSLIAGGAFLLIGNSSEETSESSNSANSEELQPVEDTSQETVTYTTQEVASRNTEQDCWTIIDGAVYDLTSYIPRHPGGDEVLLACGTDGSTLFNQRQTSTGEKIGSGTPHNASAANQLNTYFIGFLEN